MKWQTIREQFPNRWVLVEALSTQSKGNIRVLEEMAVISEFNETHQAWQAYKKYHLSNPSREYYIFHTVNTNIEVTEQPFTGVRRVPQ